MQRVSSAGRLSEATPILPRQGRRNGASPSRSFCKSGDSNLSSRNLWLQLCPNFWNSQKLPHHPLNRHWNIEQKHGLIQVRDFRPSRCLKFLQVFLALERICANATSPNNRSRSLKPVKLGVARLDTWLSPVTDGIPCWATTTTNGSCRGLITIISPSYHHHSPATFLSSRSHHLFWILDISLN